MTGMTLKSVCGLEVDRYQCRSKGGRSTFSTVYSETGPIRKTRSSRRSNKDARRFKEISTVRSTFTRGYCSLNAFRNSGSQACAMVSDAPTRNNPSVSEGLATRCLISSSTNNICSAYDSNKVPCLVRTNAPEPRSNRDTRSSCSRFEMRVETAGCERFMRSAAFLKPPKRATHRNVWIWSKVMPHS